MQHGRCSVIGLVLGALLASSPEARAQVVFSSDFESGMPSEISGGGLEGVQGYAGLGPPGNQFGGQFLRNTTTGSTTLTLSGLPAHTAVDVGFLLAVIDSWDGSSGGFPSGDFFTVRVNGVTVFNESFENSNGGFSASYIPPPGGELAYKVNLGFSVGVSWLDSAYDMTLEPSLQNIPHTSSTLTLELSGGGNGYQGGTDESFAIENLVVDLDGPVGVPALSLPGIVMLSLMLVAGAWRIRLRPDRG